MENLEASSEKFVSREGYEFNLGQDIWSLSRDVAINIKSVRPRLNVFVSYFYVRVLANLATSYAPLTVVHIHQCFKKLVKFSALRDFDCDLLISFRELTEVEDGDFVFIKILFREWIILGYYGVQESAVEMITGWRLAYPVVGDAIKRLDPECGPLSDLELQAVLEQSAQKYEIGELEISDIAMLLLVQMSGRRPYQLACLKLKDLLLLEVSDDVCRYFIDIPRAKQRSGGFRKEFRKVELIKEYWEVIQAQRNALVDLVTLKIGHELCERICRNYCRR